MTEIVFKDKVKKVSIGDMMNGQAFLCSAGNLCMKINNSTDCDNDFIVMNDGSIGNFMKDTKFQLVDIKIEVTK